MEGEGFREERSDIEAAAELGRDIMQHFNQIMQDVFDLQEMLRDGRVTQEEYDEILNGLQDGLMQHEAYFRFFQRFFDQHAALRTDLRQKAMDLAQKRAELMKLFSATRVPNSVRPVLIASGLDDDPTPAFRKFLKDSQKIPKGAAGQWSATSQSAQDYLKQLKENIQDAKRDNDPLEQIPVYQTQAKRLGGVLEIHIIPAVRDLLSHDPSWIDEEGAKTLLGALEDTLVESQNLALAHHKKVTAWLPPHTF